MTVSAATRLDVAPSEERRHRTLWHDAARRFMRNRLAVAGLAIVVVFLTLAVFADLVAPYPYDKVYYDRVLRFPFELPGHPLGTDEVGRDYLSRLIYGARTSMTVGIAVQMVALVIGVPLGSLAGFVGGRTDFVISRFIDIMTAFPGLMFSILIISVWGGGIAKVIFALSITSWIGIARLTRGQILSLREKEYVEAARCTGVSRKRIILRHLLPNALTPILVAISFGIPAAMWRL